MRSAVAGRTPPGVRVWPGVRRAAYPQSLWLADDDAVTGGRRSVHNGADRSAALTKEIVMLAQLASYIPAEFTHPGPGWNHGPGAGGPGWWLIFPILFWTAVIALVGYVIYRRSPQQQARGAAERALAEAYARGEISEDELKQRRSVLRGKG